MAQNIRSTDLDNFVSEVFAKNRMAGASVLVAEKQKILLNKGYGFAHVGLQVKADKHTKYNLVGPGMIILGAAILQQVERGRLALDNEVSQYLPQFPTKGKKITIRHLLSSTSGLPDYHYLGDPLESVNHAMHLDEIIQLFSGRDFVIEPGSRFDWSVSNFALLVAVLEASTGQTYEQYLQENFFSPASTKNIQYYNPYLSITNYAQGYKLADTLLTTASETLLKYDPHFRVIGTAEDLFTIWDGIKGGKLLSPSLFKLMTDSTEAVTNNSAHFRYAIASRREEWGSAIGFRGGMPGYSTYFAYFPATDITIIVLSNTSPQQAYEIGRQLERYLHGWPPLPHTKQENKSIEILPVSKTEEEQLAGTYRLSRNPGRLPVPESFILFQRTLRIFSEHNQLMFQLKGESPQKLFKATDGNFYLDNRTDIAIRFTTKEGTTEIEIRHKNSDIDRGKKSGPPDVKNFHAPLER